MDTLLEVKNLTKHFALRRGFPQRVVGALRAVDGVNVTVQPGETFGLVGESGCGKSTLGKTILGIYQPTSGEVHAPGPEDQWPVQSGNTRCAARHPVRLPGSGSLARSLVDGGTRSREPLQVHATAIAGRSARARRAMVTAVRAGTHLAALSP